MRRRRGRKHSDKTWKRRTAAWQRMPCVRRLIFQLMFVCSKIRSVMGAFGSSGYGPRRSEWGLLLLIHDVFTL